ncbi:MAG: hypothetical protein ACTHMC_01455 [Pseudobacter sp.]|uniref:hypothetical protein n=1 Tax=Pseudobacter sp. TaxID=2045420 RepID=UPI003F7F6A12
MNLIEYLPYYLDCGYWTENSQGHLNYETLGNVIDMVQRGRNVQLFLRPLSSMTEEEAGALYRIASCSFFEPQWKIVSRTNGYTEGVHRVHESVVCYRFDVFSEHPLVMDYLPDTLLQLDDEDSSFTWGRFSNAGTDLDNSVEDELGAQVHFLLQRKFDLFGLIAADHAVNINKIQTA